MRVASLQKLGLSVALSVSVLIIPALAFAQGDTLLKPGDTQRLLPGSVFYTGQSATTQLRNSGGVKFADGSYVLATMVDTSGYSSDVSAKYQAYFITETALKIGGHNLPAGIYGIGFIGGNKFVVTDVGAHERFSIDTSTDAGLKRPMPLQV